MRTKAIITLVGTSVLTNAALAIKKDPRASVEDDEIMEWASKNEWPAISAELHSLYRINRNRNFDYHSGRLIFLCTDTKRGQRALDLLLGIIGSYDGDCAIIPGLTEQQFDGDAIFTFCSTLFDIIEGEEKRENEVIVNATGGFKALTAYAFMIAMLTKTPVCYLYEHHTKIISFPSLPLTWDRSFADPGFAELINFLQSRPTTEAFYAKAKELKISFIPDKYNFFYERTNGNVAPTDLGPILVKFFNSGFSPQKTVFRDTPEIDSVRSAGDHRPAFNDDKTISALNDIVDPDARVIARRCLHLPFVSGILFTKSLQKGARKGTYWRLKNNPDNNATGVTYICHTRYGGSIAEVQVQKGSAQKLVDLFGKEVHA